MRETVSRCLDAILNSAADGAEEVRDQIIRTITVMAGKDLVGTLRKVEQWLTTRKHSSTPILHRHVLVRALISITRELLGPAVLPNDLREALVRCSISEMTAVADLTSEWSKDSSVLTAELAGMYPAVAAPALLELIPTQGLPHFFVLDALTKFAEQFPLRFIPFLKETMSKVLPLLTSAKQDNHRMLFSQLLASFSEAVLQLSSRNEQLTPRSQDSAKMKREDFSDTMYSAIQFFVNDWSKTSDLRVRCPVVHALGSMYAICSDENRIGLIPKILPIITTAMKRERAKDQLPVSKGFACLFLYPADAVTQALVPHMEGLLQILLQAVVSSFAEMSTSPTVKLNLAALLEAAENIAVFHVDGIVTFLSKNLDAKSQMKDPNMRAGCLQIIRHLISRKALEPRLEPFRDSIIATVKLTTGDTDWRVRRAFSSVVISMGTSPINYFGAIGGPDLLTYIIKNASIPDQVVNDFNEASKKKDQGFGTSPEEIRDNCRNTLALFCSSSQGKLDKNLWPFLFEHMNEHVTNPNLLTSFPTICRCLVQLGARVGQTEFFYVDFKVAVNVPKPGALAAKFLVQSMQLGYYTNEELHSILEAMSTVAPLLDDPFSSAEADAPTPIANLWMSSIPELQKGLIGDSVNPQEWEELLSKLVNKTMTAKQNESWVEEVTSACLAQLPTYVGQPSMMRSALLIIGIGISRCSRREFVSSAVETIVDVANHDSGEHRMGLAKAFGFIAALHPDITIEKLGFLSKGPEKRGFFQSKDPKKKELSENSRTIAGLGLCYAFRRMKTDIQSSRLDASILPTLSTILQECKVQEVRDACYEALLLLEAPLNKLPNFVFKGRDDFLDSVLKTLPPLDLKAQTPSTAPVLRTLGIAMKSITTLISCVALPTISAGLQDRLVSLVVLYLSRPWAGIDPKTEMATLQIVFELINAVFMSNTKSDLDSILTVVLPHTVSTKDVERIRSMTIITRLVECAANRLERCVANSETASAIVSLGTILGRLVPRFMDNLPEVRILGAEGIVATFRLISFLHPKMLTDNNIDVSAAIKEILGLKGRLQTIVKDGTAVAEKEVASITKLLCMQIVTVLPEQQLFSPLLDVLLVAGLTDPQDDASSCSCVVMHGMIRGLGGQLTESSVKKNLENLIDAIQKLGGKREQSLNGILVSIRNLTKHHNLLCFNALLKYEAPHSDAVVKAIQSVAGDSSLAKLFILHTLDTILNSQLVEDRPDAKDKRTLVKDLAPTPLSSACALGWLCETVKGAEIVSAEHRAAVYCSLMLYLTAAHDMKDAAKIGYVAHSLKISITATAPELTTDRMERFGWGTLTDAAAFPRAFAELTKYLCREELNDTIATDRGLAVDPKEGLPLPAAPPTQVAVDIAQFILPYINKPIQSHRRAAINICSSLMRYSLGEKRLLQSIITGLLGRCGTDENWVLRSEALVAFRHLPTHPYSDIVPYVSPIFSALLANFNERTEVAVVATQTANDLTDRISDKSQIAPIVVNIILKLKSLFEIKEPALRSISISMFGLLLNLAKMNLMDDHTMMEQVMLHFATLLVHSDEDEQVCRQASKVSLCAALSFISAKFEAGPEASTKITELLSRPYMQPANKINFEEFANEFAFLWVAYFAGKVNDLLVSLMIFFTSERECLRVSSVVLCGYVLKHLPSQDIGRANVDQLLNALTGLLNPAREKSALVRQRSVRAMGMLREL